VATIMSGSGKDGRQRRCTSRCHHAEGPDCDCICGGRYHGCARSIGSGEPKTIIDAELMCQGLDPDAIDTEIKRRISQEVLEKFVGKQDVNGKQLQLF
jgi:hypothetical protein